MEIPTDPNENKIDRIRKSLYPTPSRNRPATSKADRFGCALFFHFLRQRIWDGSLYCRYGLLPNVIVDINRT